MNSDLIPHFERIERELASLMLANKRALEDAAERDRIRIGESEARESARAEEAVERRGLRSVEGARDRMKLRMEWMDVADAAPTPQLFRSTELKVPHTPDDYEVKQVRRTTFFIDKVVRWGSGFEG